MKRNDALARSFSIVCFWGAVTLAIVEILTRDAQQDFARDGINTPSQTVRSNNASVSPLRFVSPAIARQLQQQFNFTRSAANPSPTANRPQRLVVDLSDRRVTLYDGDRAVANYPVAIGKPGWETPTGEFVVQQKLENPAWKHPITGERVPPGENNPLGDRWIGFWSDGNTAIGFHGTGDRHSVGQAISHGCLRMQNTHIRQLFDRVPLETPVFVQQ